MQKTFLRKKIKNKRTLKKRMKGGMNISVSPNSNFAITEEEGGKEEALMERKGDYVYLEKDSVFGKDTNNVDGEHFDSLTDELGSPSSLIDNKIVYLIQLRDDDKKNPVFFQLIQKNKSWYVLINGRKLKLKKERREKVYGRRTSSSSHEKKDIIMPYVLMDKIIIPLDGKDNTFVNDLLQKIDATVPEEEKDDEDFDEDFDEEDKKVEPPPMYELNEIYIPHVESSEHEQRYGYEYGYEYEELGAAELGAAELGAEEMGSAEQKFQLVIDPRIEGSIEYGKLKIFYPNTKVKIDTHIKIDENGQLLDYEGQSLDNGHISYIHEDSGRSQDSLLGVNEDSKITYNDIETGYLLNREGFLLNNESEIVVPTLYYD